MPLFCDNLSNSLILFFSACFRAKHLGVSNHEIVSDSQMFAGTDLRPNFIARSGRLNFSKAWAAESNEHVDHWLGVDFLNFVKISSILTQGSRRFTTDYWTKSYKVSSSTDGINYEFYKELGNVC